MNNKVVFQIFRYQLLPIDRYLQGDLFLGVTTIDELIQRKNEFFSDALNNCHTFDDKRHFTVTKRVYTEDDFNIFRIALNKKIRRETIDFSDETLDNWPDIIVALWNRPDKQFIAVQKRNQAFSSCEVVVKMILDCISKRLSQYHLRAIHEPLFEKNTFWDLLGEHRGKIRSVKFDIITPNMANISKTLSDDLKQFSKLTNATRNSLKIEADPESSLHLEKDNENLNSLVDYTSEGGGSISVKIDGIHKTINTGDTIKEIEIGDIQMSGSTYDIAKILKELLK